MKLITPDPEEIPIDYWWEDAYNLLEAAQRLEHLAESTSQSFHATVHSWVFKGTDEIGFNESFIHPPGPGVLIQYYRAALKLFVATLPLYTNLHTLTILKVTVDTALWNALARLPGLHTLHFDDCKLTGYAGYHLPLRALRIANRLWADEENVSFDCPYHLVSSAQMEHLTLDSYDGAKLYLPFLVTAGIKGLLTHLQLCLPISIHDEFFTFLSLCPHLQSLVVQKCSDIVRRREPLPLDVVPSLNEYDGPPQLAELLVAGRPLRTICLRNYQGYMERNVNVEWLTPIMACLRNVAGALENLRLPPMASNLAIFPVITQLLPELHTLRLMILGEIAQGDKERIDEGAENGENSDTNGPPVGVATLDLNDEGFPVSSPDSFIVSDILTPLIDSNAHILQGLMDWVAAGHCSLPPDIEHLEIHTFVNGGLCSHARALPLPRQRRVVLRLSKAYPMLRELKLGGSPAWKRVGNSWMEPEIHSRRCDPSRAVRWFVLPDE